MKQIWTLERLVQLYTIGAQKFELPWENQTLPGFGRDAEFRDFCEQFACQVGSTSGGVAYKLAFPRRIASREEFSAQGTAYEFIRDMAAALEAGFITNEFLPTLMLLAWDTDPGARSRIITKSVT